MYYENRKQKVPVAILISDKIDIKTKMLLSIT